VSAAYFANFYGVGGNGKGVLLRLMQKILGSYAVSLSPKAIVLQGRDTEGRFDLTDLPGARLAIIDDVPEGRLAEGTIKQLTGEGTMRIERKFKDSFQFTPIAKLTLASNKQLTIKDTGNSMRRRMRTIPFDFIPTKDKLDPRLEEKLLQEGPSILFWAIEEAGLYLSNPGPAGLPGCTVIDEASKEYLDSQDTTRLFLEEKTEKSGDESESGVKARELYEAYKTWCEENGYKAKTNHIFGKELKLIGIEKSRTHQGRLYNVKLKN
jgi:putative DNA primase/helicase